MASRGKSLKLYKKHRYLKQYTHPQSDLLDEDSQKEQLERYFKGKIIQEDLKESLQLPQRSCSTSTLASLYTS